MLSLLIALTTSSFLSNFECMQHYLKPECPSVRLGKGWESLNCFITLVIMLICMQKLIYYP